MKTPYTYTKAIKHGFITTTMLELCLYSCNKRAKNMRDQERAYRSKYRRNYYRIDYYDNVGQYNLKKHEYYSYKDKLLTLIDPICIHKEHVGYMKERIYDYETKKFNKALKYLESNETAYNYAYSNYYYDPERSDYVTFIDVPHLDSPRFFYYLYYQLGNHSFHTPIEKQNLEFYKSQGLHVKEIEPFITHGEEITDLISVQFVKKVIDNLDRLTLCDSNFKECTKPIIKHPEVKKEDE